jgi:LytS/YehU family sensor histidine kinase
LAFVDTFKKHGLLGHFTSLSFAFTVFYEFRNQFGLIILAKTMKYFMENTIKQKQLNNLTHELEAKFLQSQLNPHFLFNSLNNMYGLILNQKPETQTAISQLQSLLKQSFDDLPGSKVPLQSEVDYLKNYVHLEKIRHDKNVTIDFDTDEAALQHTEIAPRVLLPFVENAFKHGLVNNLDRAQISIHLSVKDRQLDFKVKNTKPVLKINKTNVGGIGLVNIRRRLSLLYPNHLLTIQDNSNEYEVNLKLYL